MAITAANSMANFAMKKGLNPDYIMPTMEETEVFAQEAADVATQAIKQGVARIKLTHQQVYDTTLRDIKEARDILNLLMEENFVKKPDMSLIENAVKKAVDSVK
jgi:malate dehydrogenase (oxaloacetate-decarboxylating)